MPHLISNSKQENWPPLTLDPSRTCDNVFGQKGLAGASKGIRSSHITGPYDVYDTLTLIALRIRYIKAKLTLSRFAHRRLVPHLRLATKDDFAYRFRNVVSCRF